MPKFFHPVEHLREDHPAYAICKSCSEELQKDRELKAMKKLYDNNDDCQRFEKMVFESLPMEDKSVIGENNIWVQVNIMNAYIN